MSQLVGTRGLAVPPQVEGVRDAFLRGQEPASRSGLSPDDKTPSRLGRSATSSGCAAAPKFLSTNSAASFPKTKTDDSAPRRMREIQCSSRS